MRSSLVLLAMLVLSCGAPSSIQPGSGSAATPTGGAPVPVRNVILLIGDGMGPQQIGLLETWARLAQSSTFDGPTAFAQLAGSGSTALSLTHPSGALVVDSACSATQLATGRAAPPEVVGLDANGDVALTVLEAARDSGRATGLVSDTRLTHATPAAFGAHVPHRREENEIAAQLVASGVDVMLSGGLRHFAPMTIGGDPLTASAYTGDAWAASSRRSDERDLVAEAHAAGYSVAFDRDDLAAAPPGRLLGLFANSSMADALQARNLAGDPTFTEPSLEEMAIAALDRLDADPDGFFVMIEGGQIDWAGHENDAGWMLHEMVRFERTVAAVLRWTEGRDDTLVILTADHETGGFGFSYSAAELPTPVVLPGDGMMGQALLPQFNFGDLTTLDILYAQSQTIGQALSQWDALTEPTPLALTVLLRATIGVDFREDDALSVLATEPNAYRAEGHEYLDTETVPAIADFGAFYVYPDERRQALVARTIADDLGIVWSTGTHTATPVAVFASGPDQWEQQIAGIVHHADVGELMFRAMGLR